jgi:DEAD/DEAH box helicase domain-containing protein
MSVLKALLENSSSRAFFIFPTKALAQDQKRAFQGFLSKLESVSQVCINTLDGDTSLRGDTRKEIRDKANIIFTNPDMLHVSILPHHSYWKSFFQNLKFVVVDELHCYTGSFGAHVAMVMRRLTRICHHYGNSSVRFIACSATISNPEYVGLQFT